MSLTRAARRRARKRQKIAIAGGGLTSPRRAAQYVADGRARFNDAGELEFLVAHPRHVAAMRTLAAPLPRFIERPYDPVEGYRFRWYADQSGGLAVMKALSHAPFA